MVSHKSAVLAVAAVAPRKEPSRKRRRPCIPTIILELRRPCRRGKGRRRQGHRPRPLRAPGLEPKWLRIAAHGGPPAPPDTPGLGVMPPPQNPPHNLVTPRFLIYDFFTNRRSSILGVWAASSGLHTFQKKWGSFTPHHFGRFPGRPGAAQTPKIDDFRSVTKVTSSRNWLTALD